MQTAVTTIQPDGSRTTATHELPPEPGLRALRGVLGPIFAGADFEHVAVLHEGRRTDMFVDENGHAKGLTRNDAGTAIYRANAMRQDPTQDPEALPFIVGPVALFDRRVWF